MVTVPRSSGVVPNEGDHPSGDNRFEILDATMKRYRFAPDALIEVLHSAQELFGYLQPDLLYYIAHAHEAAAQPGLRCRHLLPLLQACSQGKSHVHGLHRDGVLRSGEPIGSCPPSRDCLETVAGKTTADGQVSLMTARCLGVCGLAPVAVYDGEVSGNQSPESALERMKGWTHHGSR